MVRPSSDGIVHRSREARASGKRRLFRKSEKKAFSGHEPAFFRKTGMYHPEIFELDDAYLSGFWACEKYYADILPKLRELIVFPKQEEEPGSAETFAETGQAFADSADAARRNRELMERMRQEISVSLHIRRGDYLDPENAAMFGGICTDAYYEAAVNFIRERFPAAHFYVFSDDPAYARERYREPEFYGCGLEYGQKQPV